MRLKNLLVAACAAALITPALASAAPSASISGPDVVERGRHITWVGTASDVGGYGTYYEWDFTNDGTYDTGIGFYGGIAHTYDTLGTKTLKLRASGMTWAGGPQTASAEATKTITVVNAVPDVAAACDREQAETGEQVTCEQDYADDIDGEVVGVAWDVDGDGFDDGQGSEVTASYPTAGEKTVRMRVTDNDGGSAIAEVGVDVWAPGAGPAFEINPQPATEGDEVTFTAPLEPGEEGDVVVERKWDLDGDGQWDEVGTGDDYRTVSAFYDEAGSVQVRLRTREDGAAADTAKVTTQTLVVKAKPVVVDPKPGDKGSGGNGGASGGTGSTGGRTTAAPVPTLGAAPVTFRPAASRTVAPSTAKKKVAKKAKCKKAKGKKAKRSRKCAAKKSRAKTRKRR
jgi:hypothetical protein